ncbi:MAG: hypothetical protein AAF828_00295 [Bacteroidota bacterium]
MIRYTRHSLKKLETLFSEIEYTVRYERGNFQSGYCLVENRRIAVINKFYDIEGRINCLLEILGQQDLTAYAEHLSPASMKFLKEIKSTTNEEE